MEWQSCSLLTHTHYKITKASALRELEYVFELLLAVDQKN